MSPSWKASRSPTSLRSVVPEILLKALQLHATASTQSMTSSYRRPITSLTAKMACSSYCKCQPRFSSKQIVTHPNEAIVLLAMPRSKMASVMGKRNGRLVLWSLAWVCKPKTFIGRFNNSRISKMTRRKNSKIMNHSPQLINQKLKLLALLAKAVRCAVKRWEKPTNLVRLARERANCQLSSSPDYSILSIKSSQAIWSKACEKCCKSMLSIQATKMLHLPSEMTNTLNHRII